MKLLHKCTVINKLVFEFSLVWKTLCAIPTLRETTDCITSLNFTPFHSALRKENKSKHRAALLWAAQPAWQAWPGSLCSHSYTVRSRTPALSQSASHSTQAAAVRRHTLRRCKAVSCPARHIHTVLAVPAGSATTQPSECHRCLLTAQLSSASRGICGRLLTSVPGWAVLQQH